MALPPELRESEIWKAFSAARENAREQLLQLQGQFEDQATLLSKWLGTSANEAEQKLAELAENGAAAIPPGLRQDVIDAYNNLARVYVEAPDELKPYLDPPGTQAARLALTEKASQIMTSGGMAAGGGAAAATVGAAVAGVSTWPAWVTPAMIGLALLFSVGGLWTLFHQRTPAILGTWHADSCGYSDAVVLNLTLDNAGKVTGTMTTKDILEVVTYTNCKDAKWDGSVSQAQLIEPKVSGNVLSFSTTLAGNVQMRIVGNTLIWSAPSDTAGDGVVTPGERYVFTRSK